MAFRAGGGFGMTNGSSIQVRGGSANDNPMPPSAPGGGGSGGSCVLQVGAAVSMNGLVDARGGFGGHPDDRVIFNVEVRGGDGAAGFVRLEAPNSLPASALGVTIPVARSENVGPLTDTDAVVGSQSLWYSSGQTTAPTWVRYEVEAIVDGVPQRYSDDPTRGALAGTGEAVQFLVQGRDNQGPPVVAPWRSFVGAAHGSPSLDADSATDFRFALLFDRSVAQQVVVSRVRVFFQ